MWTPSRTLLNSAMALLGGDTVPAGTTLDGAFLGLLKDPISYNIDSDDSVVTNGEANYEGYARQAISAWTGPNTGQGGFSLLSDGAHVFAPTGDDTVNTIFGQFLIGSDSTTVLAVEMYDGAIPLPAPADALVSLPIFGAGPNAAGYGRSLVSN